MLSKEAQPTYLYISDPHGASDKFDALLRHGLGMKHEETLTAQSIAEACEREGVEMIYLLGDLLDRAPDPVATFRTATEVIASGKGRYVTGNHDFWAMMNLLGIHIPNDGQGKAHWAKIFAAHIEHTKKQQKEKYGKMYQGRLEDFENNYGAELRKLDEKTGLMKEGDGKDLLNYPEKYQATKNTAINEDDALRSFWAELLGRNVEILVYTGLRDVESMSLGWFEAKLLEAKNLANKYPEDTLLQEMPGQLHEIVESYRASLDAQVEKYGEDYRSVDQLMVSHYLTPEWWSYDWVRHKGWGSADGGGLLNVLNDQLPAQEQKLDYGNYFENKTIQEFAVFYKETFNLYERDAYGNALLHSMLPFDDRGIVSIGRVDSQTGMIATHDEKGERIEGLYYKGVHYTNQDIFQGFDAIAKDIRDFDEKTQSTAEIREALTLVNSIYADETTIIKPKMIAQNLIAAGRLAAGAAGGAGGASAAGAAGAAGGEMSANDMGTDELRAMGLGMALNRIEVPIIICGHNTIDKLETNGMGVLNRDDKQMIRSINIDGGMAPKFKGRGMIAKMSSADDFGLEVYGYSGKDTDIQLQEHARVGELFAGQ